MKKNSTTVAIKAAVPRKVHRKLKLIGIYDDKKLPQVINQALKEYAEKRLPS